MSFTNIVSAAMAFLIGFGTAFLLYSTSLFSLREATPTNSTVAISIVLMSVPVVLLSIFRVRKLLKIPDADSSVDLLGFLFVGFALRLAAPLALGFGAAWEFPDGGRLAS